jgi:hypothetical protein
MDSGSLCVAMCMKALNGTGVEPEVVLLLEEPPPPPAAFAGVRELMPGELALCEAAEPPTGVDTTVEPALPAEDRAELELPERAELLVVDRFNTDGTAVNDEPLRVDVGDSRGLPEEAVLPAPAPEEEPAVFEATAVGVPVWEA